MIKLVNADAFDYVLEAAQTDAKKGNRQKANGLREAREILKEMPEYDPWNTFVCPPEAGETCIVGYNTLSGSIAKLGVYDGNHIMFDNEWIEINDDNKSMFFWIKIPEVPDIKSEKYKLKG